MNKLPKARNENIVVQNLADEVLIYDTNTNQAYCLNETSANIFNYCDGTTSFDELKTKYKYTDDLIFLALDELKEKNLLDEKAEYGTPFAGMSRREAVRKVGFATMIALPVISAIIAPSAASAASNCRTAGVIPNSSAQNPAACGSTPVGTANTQCNTAFGTQCCSGTAVFNAVTSNSNPCVFNCRCT